MLSLPVQACREREEDSLGPERVLLARSAPEITHTFEPLAGRGKGASGVLEMEVEDQEREDTSVEVVRHYPEDPG